LESYVSPGGRLTDMSMGRKTIYAVGMRGLGIIEAAPSLGTLSWTHGAGYTAMTGLYLQGSKVFVSRLGLHGLVVIDAAQPTAPEELGRTMTLGLGWDVAVDGDTAYVAHGILGVGAYDVSDPQSIGWTGQLWPGGRIVTVAVMGRGGWLAAGRANGKVYICDLTAAQPEVVAELDASFRLSEIAFRQGRLWVLSKKGDRAEIFERTADGSWEKAGEVTGGARKQFFGKTSGARGYTIGKKTVEAYLFEAGN
jgi:hypothetical protein